VKGLRTSLSLLQAQVNSYEAFMKTLGDDLKIGYKAPVREKPQKEKPKFDENGRLVPKVPFEEDPEKESNIAPLVDASWVVHEDDVN